MTTSSREELFLPFPSERACLNPKLVVDAGYMTGLLRQDQIQGNSLDLTVKSVYYIDGPLWLLKDGRRRIPNYVEVPTVRLDLYKDGGEFDVYQLSPGHVYQVEFDQIAQLPTDIMGLTFPRSTMSKSGAMCETGVFDSGYHGDCGMTLSVKNPSIIEKGAAVAQMVFFRANSARSYSGYYQESMGLWRNIVEGKQ